ncbi:unnamed protein product, partial [Didymodactylos carnosus]
GEFKAARDSLKNQAVHSTSAQNIFMISLLCVTLIVPSYALQMGDDEDDHLLSYVNAYIDVVNNFIILQYVFRIDIAGNQGLDEFTYLIQKFKLTLNSNYEQYVECINDNKLCGLLKMPMFTNTQKARVLDLLYLIGFHSTDPRFKNKVNKVTAQIENELS